MALIDKLKNIGDAIRNKTGKTDLLTLEQMPEEIEAIETGITPEGTITITENDTYDVTQYASAEVNVDEGVAEALDEEEDIIDTLKTIIAKKSANDAALPSVLDGSIKELNAENLAGVNRLDDYSFYQCLSLEKIDIPDTIESIGYYSFVGCKNLNVIRLSEKTNLDRNVFAIDQSSSRVTDIYVDSLKQWLSYVPQYSSSVTTPGNGYIASSSGANLYINNIPISDLDLVIDSKNINNGAFNYIHNLTSVILTDNVKSIGNNAFSHTLLKSITIPDGVESMSSPFYECLALKEARIGSGIKELGGFSRCYQLQVVHLSQGLETIKGSAFEYCTQLKFIAIPHTVKTINSQAFYKCDKICIDLTDYGVDYEFPELVNSNAISNNSNVQILVMKDRKSVLESMTNWSTFSSRIIEVENRPEVPEITNSFELTSSGLTQGTCTDIEMTIPDTIDGKSVTKIAMSGFTYSPAEKITIPDSVTSIDREAFLASYAKYIKFSNKISSIPYKCFYAGRPYEVIIPDNINTIGDDSFSNTSLRKVYFGKNVSNLSAASFYCGPHLTEITVHDENKYFSAVDNMLVDTSNTIWLYCGGSSQRILDMNTLSFSPVKLSAYSFFNSRNLEKVVISNGVTSIGSNTFGYCFRLKEIVIAPSVKSLGSYAFNSCSQLKIVDMTAFGIDADGNKISFPSLGSTSSFSGPPSFKILVQKGRKEELAAMTNWSYYANNIVEVSADE